MNKLYTILAIGLLSSVANAGLITHTDYTAGSVITSAGQNTNENAIVNEFNGNINSANIAAGGVATANIAANAVDITKLSTSLQSTFTFVTAGFTYRKPILTYIDGTDVDIEANTQTANQTCIQFADERRCVTENTGSTTKYRRCVIGSNNANWTSGIEQSGTAGSFTSSSWHYVYVVKSQINTANFIIAVTTNSPTADVTNLNTMFAANGWVYLQTVRSDAAFNILNFVQNKGHTLFQNTVNTNFVGVLVSSVASAGSVSWTAAAGLNGTQLPANIIHMNVLGYSGLTSGNTILYNGNGTHYYSILAGTANGAAAQIESPVSEGAELVPSSNSQLSIYLYGVYDGIW